MKYLIITNHSYMLWQFRRELIGELMKCGDVVISMPFVGHEDDFKAMGCRCIDTKIDRRGINLLTDLKLYRFYKKLLKSECPDLVITYSIKPNIYAGYACNRLGIPYCVNVQGLGTAFQKKSIAWIVTRMYRTALKKAKKVFFENEENKNLFTSRKIINEDQVCVLPGAGINLDYYTYQEYPENTKVRFLYLGRIMREKGIDELFDAIERLYSDNRNFVVDFVGFYEDEYEAKVSVLQEKGLIVYHGFQNDPRPFYAAADCIVLPSYHEGMSNVLLEGAASGRPLITSDIPGCREAVEAGKTGFLVPSKSSDKLYEAMKSMVELERAKREQMGRLGREKIEKEFDKKDVVDRTLCYLK